MFAASHTIFNRQKMRRYSEVLTLVDAHSECNGSYDYTLLRVHELLLNAFALLARQASMINHRVYLVRPEAVGHLFCVLLQRHVYNGWACACLQNTGKTLDLLLGILEDLDFKNKA